MMYTSENNTFKLRLGDGVVVHLRDEYIIEIILGYYFANIAGIGLRTYQSLQHLQL